MIRRLLSFIPGFAFMLLLVGCAGGQDAAAKQVQRVQAGTLDVVVLSTSDTLKVGRDSFVLEFHSREDQRLLDIGTLKVNATMTMAGMPPMIGNTMVTRSPTAGRYDVATELAMAGAWRLGLEWEGPAGKGSTTLQGNVQ